MARANFFYCFVGVGLVWKQRRISSTAMSFASIKGLKPGLKPQHTGNTTVKMLLKLVLHMLLVMGDRPPTSALPCAVTHVWVERAKAIAGLFYSTVDRITAQSTLAMRVVATVRTHFKRTALLPIKLHNCKRAQHV